jgi:hypothetical protein
MRVGASEILKVLYLRCGIVHLHGSYPEHSKSNFYCVHILRDCHAQWSVYCTLLF